MFRADCRGLRNARRSGSAAAVRHGGGARRPARGVGVVHVRGVRFFRREARTAGVDVHGAVRRRPASDAGRRAGACRKSAADLHAALTVSFADAVHGVERQVLVTRQVLCGACAGAGQMAIAEAQCRQCQGDGPRPLGARPHGVLQAVRGVRRRRPADARALRGLCADRAAASAAKRSACRCPPGITDGGRLRVRGDGARGPARRPRRVTCMSRSTFSRTRGFGAKATTWSATCRWRCTKRRSARASTCRRSRGRSSCGSRRARQSGQRLRVAGGGLVTATGERGDLVFEVTLVLPRRLDERSMELMREFGERNGRAWTMSGDGLFGKLDA